MQTLSARHGFDTLHRALRFLSLQLSVRDATQALGQEIDGLRQKARAAQDAWDDAFTRRVAASANIAYRDTLLDKAVIDLARDVAAAPGALVGHGDGGGAAGRGAGALAGAGHRAGPCAVGGQHPAGRGAADPRSVGAALAEPRAAP